MYSASSKPEINVSALPFSSGFKSSDNKKFNKTINHLNQEYTFTITFKDSDSDLHKETFLKKINGDIENTANYAVKLGLGRVKGPTPNKPT
ncbi:MAG: hypothetical protein H0U27_04830, partial [Nitrosopumilus sp.]|nr:hypothetical protein [Nitrosopumilus sp.]